MELYIFDRDLNFKGIIDNFSSLRWVRRYSKSGEFELQCPLTNDSLNLVQREYLIYKKDDIEAGFIEYRQLKQDTEGKEILVIKGKFLTSYLNRRVIWGTEILNSTAEIAMRTLVDNNCISSNSDRVINNFILGTLHNFSESVNYQTSYSNLSDELETLSNLGSLGHRVNFDISDKKLIFDIYKGFDRSVNQSTNPRAIFAKEFENIMEQEYVDSLNNYKNLCLVGGTGEGTARKMAVVGNSTGLDRFEVFNDQKSLSNVIDNVTMSDADYLNLLINKGNETLAETKEIQTFDSKINLNSNLKYKTDFDLGDIVTCISKKWGITLDTRITEIEEVYEEQGQQINVTFGNSVPTLIDKLKQKIK